MHFLNTLTILLTGLTTTVYTSPLSLPESTTSTSLLERALPPNFGSTCNSFSVGTTNRNVGIHVGQTNIPMPNGFFGALCKSDLDLKGPHPTDVGLDKFITLVDSKMVWQYKPDGNTFSGYCSSCTLGSDWVLTCSCSAQSWKASYLGAGRVTSSINIFRKDWNSPGVWYNAQDNGGQLNVAA